MVLYSVTTNLFHRIVILLGNSVFLFTSGREDLGKQRQRHQHLVIPNRDGNTAKIGKDEEDGMEYMDMQVQIKCLH